MRACTRPTCVYRRGADPVMCLRRRWRVPTSSLSSLVMLMQSRATRWRCFRTCGACPLPALSVDACRRVGHRAGGIDVGRAGSRGRGRGCVPLYVRPGGTDDRRTARPGCGMSAQLRPQAETFVRCRRRPRRCRARRAGSIRSRGPMATSRLAAFGYSCWCCAMARAHCRPTRS